MKSWIRRFLLFVIIDSIYTLIVSYIINYFNPTLTEIGGWYEKTLLYRFIVSVLVAPLLETFIIQFFIIEVLKELKVNNKYIIIIAAILFALPHTHNLAYILAMLFPGVILAYYYILEREYNGRLIAFVSVFLLHAFANLFAFILDDLLGVV